MDLTLQYLKEGKRTMFGFPGPRPPALISEPQPPAYPPPLPPKNKIQLAQTPPTLSPVTMIMVYGYMDYLNHVDLLILNFYVLRKQPYCFMHT